MNPIEANLLLPTVYGLYAAVSVALTVWLARVLSTNGAIFLRDVFGEQNDLAVAVNKLLVVGFYLVNLGWAAMQLTGGRASNLQQAIETLATKLGTLLLTLAAMHFANLIVFQRIRSRARVKQVVAPFRPDAWVPPMTGTQGHVPNT